LKPLLTFIFFLLFICSSIGQFDTKLGEWKGYLSYQQGRRLTQTPDKIVYSTPLSLVLIDKEELSPTFLSKVDGLSNVGIRQVEYDPFTDQLAVIYDNSALDFIGENGIAKIQNIATNTAISGDKRINDIYFHDVHTTFLATGFGVVTFDQQSRIFGTTTFTGIPVKAIVSSTERIYAGTEEGIYSVPLSGVNIADFNQWSLQSEEAGLPSLYEVIDLAVHKGDIIAATETGLWVLQNSDWRQIYMNQEGEEISFISPSSDRLIVGWSTGDFSSIVRFFDNSYDWITRDDGCSTIALDATLDEKGRIWYADGVFPFRWTQDYQSSCNQTSFASPFSPQVSDIVIENDNVIIASGGVAENFNYLFGREGFYLKTGNTWQNFNEFLEPRFKEFDALSLFRVAIHPSLPKIYGGSYWAGLLEYDIEQDQYQLFNKTNSTLRGSIGDPARERTSGLAFDEEENLWVTAYNAPQPLNVLSADGRWMSFPVTSPGTLSDIVIDQQNFKWAPVFGSSGGVLVYDSGESIQNRADDRQRYINRSNSALTGQANCVLVDREGEVWVGTTEGPVIFDCGSGALESDCLGIKRIVLQDSIGAFLLADQDIRTMEVDGANNKWFGTRNGVFVQSPDGQEQLAHFTVNNSPLFDNQIQALAYDGQSGDMYIGTNKGVLSYRTKTTTGAIFQRKSEVYAFPNPVRPEYTGPIGIRGLVTDALVTITDINGLLVSEIQAQGGQATWDGNDLSGRRANSGVYLVWSTEPDAFDTPDAIVTKIVLVR
jgi:hypothetical protein